MTTPLPEDSVLRRHAMQLQEAGIVVSASRRPEASQAPAGSSAVQASANYTAGRESKGFFGRLMDKLFGG